MSSCPPGGPPPPPPTPASVSACRPRSQSHSHLDSNNGKCLQGGQKQVEVLTVRLCFQGGCAVPAFKATLTCTVTKGSAYKVDRNKWKCLQCYNEAVLTMRLCCSCFQSHSHLHSNKGKCLQGGQKQVEVLTMRLCFQGGCAVPAFKATLTWTETKGSVYKVDRNKWKCLQ